MHRSLIVIMGNKSGMTLLATTYNDYYQGYQLIFWV